MGADTKAGDDGGFTPLLNAGEHAFLPTNTFVIVSHKSRIFPEQVQNGNDETRKYIEIHW